MFMPDELLYTQPIDFMFNLASLKRLKQCVNSQRFHFRCSNTFFIAGIYNACSFLTNSKYLSKLNIAPRIRENEYLLITGNFFRTFSVIPETCAGLSYITPGNHVTSTMVTVIPHIHVPSHEQYTAWVTQLLQNRSERIYTVVVRKFQ